MRADQHATTRTYRENESAKCWGTWPIGSHWPPPTAPTMHPTPAADPEAVQTEGGNVLVVQIPVFTIVWRLSLRSVTVATPIVTVRVASGPKYRPFQGSRWGWDTELPSLRHASIGPTTTTTTVTTTTTAATTSTSPTSRHHHHYDAARHAYHAFAHYLIN